MQRTLDEGNDTLVVLQRLLLLDQVDLVLEDDDVLELHDLDSGQVLGRLWLGARFVTRDEKEGGVHDGSTVQHSGHQNVVARAVNERDMADEFHAVTTPWALARWVIFFV